MRSRSLDGVPAGGCLKWGRLARFLPDLLSLSSDIVRRSMGELDRETWAPGKTPPMVDVGTRRPGAYRLPSSNQVSLMLDVRRIRDASSYSVERVIDDRNLRLSTQPVTPDGWTVAWETFYSAAAPSADDEAVRRTEFNSIVSTEIDRRISEACLAGGSGLAPFHKGLLHEVRFRDSSLAILQPGVAVRTLDYSDVLDLEVHSHSTTRGGGFVGGGLGFSAAVEAWWQPRCSTP
jgi:hypothetical protein